MPAKFDLKLRKVAKSFVVTIPGPVVQGLSWKEGDPIVLTVEDSHITIRKGSP